MKQFSTSFQPRTGKACGYFKKYQIKLPLFSLFLLPFMIILFTGSTLMGSVPSNYCIDGWWKTKYLTLKSGIEDGDTIHLVNCQDPWNISAQDLEYYYFLKYEQRVKIKVFCYRDKVPEDAPEGMYQLWRYEYIIQDDACYRKYKLNYYLALYDHGAPIYQCFPHDTTVTSVADLPSVDEKVKIIDVCQYVAWWNVETEAVVDTTSGDTICFVRTWSSGDPSGNESSKSQKIWIDPDAGNQNQALRQLSSRRLSGDSEWKVYPNPARNMVMVYVDLKAEELVKYSVYDAMGRSVKIGEYQQGQPIMLDKLDPGIYHLQLQNKEQILGTKKLVLLE